MDRPVVLSLISFCALAACALVLCGTRAFWLSAFLGQVVATLIVYLFIGAARSIVAGAFASSLSSPDYGVSTICAAWLGTVAASMWRRRGRSLAGKASIASTCAAIGLFAYSVRPDVTVLSSEHLIAFVLGAGAAIPALSRRTLDLVWRRPVEAIRASALSLAHGRTHPIRAAGLIALPTVAAITVAPAGLAALRNEIASHFRPTVTRCANDWNRVASAKRPPVRERAATVVSLATARVSVTRGFGADARPPVWAEYCRYTFFDGTRSSIVLGLWQKGRVDRWSLLVAGRPGIPSVGDATLRPDGHIHLVNRSRRITLAS